MISFNEYTGWKEDKRKAERRATFFYNLKMVALAVVGTVCLYGMLWLGAFLDYVAGV